MLERPTRGAAFTVLEVLAVALIIAILAAFFVPRLGTFRERAEEVRCASNMRTIILALASYLQDHQNVWPQAPSMEEEKTWEAFWLQTLEPYDITARTWQCPTLWPQTSRNPEMPQVHYTPMEFNEEPGIAYRWPTQPWLIERAGGHGQGPLIGFPDGSIKSFHKILAEQGTMTSP
jgi:type II secretory pathway pseudopilin PulG